MKIIIIIIAPLTPTMNHTSRLIDIKFLPELPKWSGNNRYCHLLESIVVPATIKLSPPHPVEKENVLFGKQYFHHPPGWKF